MVLFPVLPSMRVVAMAFLLTTSAWAVETELVMFERPGCPVCLRWDRELGSIHPKSAEGALAPLRRVTSGNESGIALAEAVQYTPTFVLATHGQEVGRITGYLNDDTFWGLPGRLLGNRHEADAAR